MGELVRVHGGTVYNAMMGQDRLAADLQTHVSVSAPVQSRAGCSASPQENGNLEKQERDIRTFVSGYLGRTGSLMENKRRKKNWNI